MSTRGESPMMVTNFATILLGRIDQDVDVAGGAGAAPELERPSSDQEVPCLRLIEMVADLGQLRFE